jgi:putative addiction module killer protein
MVSDSMQIEVRKTSAFDRWFRKLGGRVFALRIDWGPGYRVYFTRRREAVILLLCAGDKRTQDADIRRAQRMATNLTE